MARIHVISSHSTNIGYGENVSALHHPLVEIRQGVNDRLSGVQIEILRSSPQFLADMKAGLVKFVQVQDPAPVAADPAPVRVADDAPPPVDKPKKGGKAKTVETDAPPSAELTETETKFLADFYAMSETDRDAFFGSLTEEEKALIVANPEKDETLG